MRIGSKLQKTKLTVLAIQQWMKDLTVGDAGLLDILFDRVKTVL